VKLGKLLGELQKNGEVLGKKLKAAGMETLERGKEMAQSNTDKVN
jgi:hypothetical protein